MNLNWQVIIENAEIGLQIKLRPFLIETDLLMKLARVVNTNSKN